MYSAHNSNTFLAYFNQIDKYLTYILGIKKYVPYHERITMICTRKTKISAYVRTVEDKLRYFGDLRNQLVHGFRLENKHYIQISEFALGDITTIHDELTKPAEIGELARAETLFVDIQHGLHETVSIMREHALHYMPVYDGLEFVGVFGFQDLLGYMAVHHHLETDKLTLADIQINTVIEFAWISSNLSIYEVQDIFGMVDSLEVVLISEDGTQQSPLLGLWSIHDVQKSSPPHVKKKG